MATVYPLWHTQDGGDPEGDENAKLLGVCSTAARAEARTSEARNLPGFRRFPDGFEIAAYEVDRDTWTEGFATFFGGQWVDDPEPPA